MDPGYNDASLLMYERSRCCCGCKDGPKVSSIKWASTTENQSGKFGTIRKSNQASGVRNARYA